MNRSILFIAAIAFCSCNNEGGYHKAEDAQDAGREFIRASLDGDYKKAEFYLLRDSTNVMLFEKQKSDYLHMSNEQKRSYRESTIRPLEIKKENDTTTTYKYYHTSNTKDTTILRVVSRNGEWLVDLKSVVKM